MTLELPQIIYLSLTLVGLGFEIAKHGEPKTGEYNVFISLAATAVILSILAWGGFFG